MPTSTRRICRAARLGPSSHTGVTLIELAVVLFILGLVAFITVPRLRDRSEAELSASADRIQTLAHYLFEEAALRGSALRLNFDLDRREVFVTSLDTSAEEPTFVIDDDPLAARYALPDSISIADVTVASADKVTSGESLAQFYPEGYADATIVHLKNERGEFKTVVIEPLSGRAKVYDGYVEAQKRAEEH